MAGSDDLHATRNVSVRSMAAGNGPFLSNEPSAHATSCTNLSRALLLLVAVLPQATTTMTLVLIDFGEGTHGSGLLLLGIRTH